MTQAWEVVVLGGGPAGLSAAIELTRLGRTVAVLERSRYDRPRAGETFGGEIEPILRSLGAWEEFTSLAIAPCRCIASAWGSAELIHRSAIFHPLGEGWHVDRTQFDAMLAQRAVSVGVFVQQGAGRCAAKSIGDGWTVEAQTCQVTGRFLIDASGRGAPATHAACPARRWLAFDRMVGIVGRMTPTGNTATAPELLLEAVQNGWWYTAPQPDGSIVVTLMTDIDLIGASSRIELIEHWSEALAQTDQTANRTAGYRAAAQLSVFGAESGILIPDRGSGWRAIGDAAFARDPLTGNGVSRALRAGLQAAAEIDQALDGNGCGIKDSAAANAQFEKYLERRADYYLREGRWQDAPFWARRQPIDWAASSVTLDPRRILTYDGRSVERDALAPVEALLPPRAIMVLLKTLRASRPAHKAMAVLRDLVPLDNRLLLAGLQLLIAQEIVKCK